MKPKPKGSTLPEWARQITALREDLGINQAELARRMECSAMTISRWERGLLQPSAEHFVQLGNLGNKTKAWFFWEMAGIEPAKMVQSLSGSRTLRGGTPRLEMARAGAGAAEKLSQVVGLPLLKGIVGTHGVTGDRRSLRTIPVGEMIGAPASWCPNPAYTSLLRVKGHSMEPLIRQGDILAVDSYQTERSQLYGKVVIASEDQHGLCVSRLRRYGTLDVLEAENRQYDPVILSKATGWRIVGKVLWWISAAP
ncbi:MAG TPA: XRE family transcriptional regulator [Candidatus Sulfotelmatobacter sp.]|nr:XRE family transcriptional regulator [Candidatus Sulfotelmatobacter sp.]